MAISGTLGSGFWWRKINNSFFLIIQAKLGFPNAPVCSVNDHPGVINPIN